MKNRQKINIKMGLILLAVAALVLVVAPTQTMAKDTDGDGFTDAEETNGLPLPEWLVGVNGETSLLYLDQAVKDSVVILVPSSQGSNLNLDPNSDGFFDPFFYVREFGINVHLVQCVANVPDCNRDLKSELGQKAIRAQESVKGSSMLGSCEEEWCTPNSGLDNIWVWTEAIKYHIASKCAGIAVSKCISDSGATGEALENLYIQHTFAHEWGHDGKLRKDNVLKTGGWHYAEKEKKINSQSVGTRTGKTSVTWFIGTTFGSNDFDDLLLWE